MDVCVRVSVCVWVCVCVCVSVYVWVCVYERESACVNTSERCVYGKRIELWISVKNDGCDDSFYDLLLRGLFRTKICSFVTSTKNTLGQRFPTFFFSRTPKQNKENLRTP